SVPNLESATAVATCPAGTSPAGGTFQIPPSSQGELFAYASIPTGNGWKATVSSADDIRSDSFEAIASCLPSALMAGERGVSATAKLNSRFPGSGDEKMVTATCPAGMQAIDGGFAGSQDPDNVVTRASWPDNSEESGWNVVAKNFTLAESASITVTAYCLPRQLAQGLIGLHRQVESASIEEGTIGARCTLGGRALGGAFITENNNAAFETMPFSAGNLGYEARYNSSRPGHDAVQLAVTCGEAAKELGGLTAEDLNRFCEIGGPLEAVHGPQATEWECVGRPSPPPLQGSAPSGNLSGESLSGRFGEVCRFIYYHGRSGQPRAIYMNLADPLSWHCFEPESQALVASPAPALTAPEAPPGAAGASGGGRPRGIVVRGSVRLPHAFPLAGTSIGVRNLLLERSARGELVRRPGGRNAAPLLLRRRRRARRNGGVLYAGGHAPRVTLDLRRRGKVLHFDLRVLGGRLRKPLFCAAGGQTELSSRFVILRGFRRLADVELGQPWRCEGKSLAP
ncbi:MAG TPA: hypothetical protein VHA76_04195, partial [Solirubrobacterales bacterium]|nr:hypothetical protein [Solirubrobacterales bacterium]